jgi:hypothetical protein
MEMQNRLVKLQQNVVRVTDVIYMWELKVVIGAP